MRVLLFAGVALGLGASGQPIRAGGGLPADDDVRKGIRRSLPYLEKEGLAWIKERRCHSCHHVPFMLWSFHEARSHGIGVDEKKLADWNDWSRGRSLGQPFLFRLADKPFKALPADLQPKLQSLLDKPFHTEKEFVDAAAKLLSPDDLARHRVELLDKGSLLKQGGVNGPGAVDVMSALLLGRDRADRTAKQSEFLTRTAGAMLAWQEHDGLWSSGNQLYGRRWQRPIAEQVSTMWALLALDSFDKPAPRVQRSIAATQAALAKGPPDANVEWLAVRLLFAQKFGTPAQTAAFHLQLRQRQNDDGGWSVLPAGKSDAFSTGQSVYALRLTGMSDGNPAMRKAQKYLLETQLEDGAWPSPAAAISATKDLAKLKRLEPIYGYWGSAWASIGLSRSLPQGKASHPETPR